MTDSSVSHELKLNEMYVQAVLDGNKRCEIRLNDRDYQKGDIIYFDALLGEPYEITHVLHSRAGLHEGYVALSIKHRNEK